MRPRAKYVRSNSKPSEEMLIQCLMCSLHQALSSCGSPINSEPTARNSSMMEFMIASRCRHSTCDIFIVSQKGKACSCRVDGHVSTRTTVLFEAIRPLFLAAHSTGRMTRMSGNGTYRELVSCCHFVEFTDDL